MPYHSFPIQNVPLRFSVKPVKMPVEIQTEDEGIKVYVATIGYKFYLEDWHTELEENQRVWIIPKSAVSRDVKVDEGTIEYKDGKITGTKIYYCIRHHTFSVTSPCMPHRTRLGQLAYHRGRVLVFKGNKISGMFLDDFVQGYPTFCARILKSLMDFGVDPRIPPEEIYLKKFAYGLGVSFEDLIQAVHKFLDTGKKYVKGEIVPEVFWDHFENLTGVRGEGNFLR